jgi:hypothetical protein
MKVGALIEQLKQFNQNAVVSIGDNYDNELEISWGYSDGCTKERCEVVNFDIKHKNEENKPEEFDYNTWE